jgi:hypothetical protein
VRNVHSGWTTAACELVLTRCDYRLTCVTDELLLGGVQLAVDSVEHGEGVWCAMKYRSMHHLLVLSSSWA